MRTIRVYVEHPSFWVDVEDGEDLDAVVKTVSDGNHYKWEDAVPPAGALVITMGGVRTAGDEGGVCDEG